MRLTSERCLTRNDRFLALDWESLGRFVRQTTLEAVAMHFVAIGIERQDASEASGDHSNSSGRRE